MSWFDDVKTPKLKRVKKNSADLELDGVWDKCRSCKEIVKTQVLIENQKVCPLCSHHGRISAAERLRFLLDDGEYIELFSKLSSKDPLEFVDKIPYKDKLKKTQQRVSHESCLSVEGKIQGSPCLVGVMDFSFMGGSLGVVAGEKITALFEKGAIEKKPVIIFSCSGGARMHEGILSLMQMAKTTAMREKLKEARVPYISVLTDPTTGGVAASFSLQGDIILAEPKALIGFAGPRVIQQTIRQTLPEGFQRSEFLFDHGQIDKIVHRSNLSKEIGFYLKFFMHE